MEVTATFDPISQLGVKTEFIITDNDRTMHVYLHHIGTHKAGKLPLHVTQLKFLYNTLYKIKVMVKGIFTLPLINKAESECEKIDALRLKKYIGCWIGKNKLLPFDEFKARAKAPIEHHFGQHEWCDREWCYAKELDMAREECENAVARASPIAVTMPPTHLPTANVTGGDKVVSPATTKVVNPAESDVDRTAAEAAPTHQPELLPL